MNFQLMTNEQILEALGNQFEELRIQKRVQNKEIINKGGASKDAINNFRHHNGDIKLSSLINILRGLDELDRLQKLLKTTTEYSPTLQGKKIPKRIYKKKNKDFKWGDEE